MTADSVEFNMVEDLPLFAGLEPHQVERLLQFSATQRYSPGTLLFSEGERAANLHVVISGTVEIFSKTIQRDWGVMLMNAGDIFMPGAVLFDEAYPTSARTLGSCRILLIDAQRVRSEAAGCGRLALALSRSLAGQFRLALRQVLDLKSRNAAQRLACFLLKIADSSDAAVPELPMRKRNLAARIGMTPETLSRTLQILADNGLLVRGREIIVRDRERIERFCGPEPYRQPIDEHLAVHIL